MPHFPSTGEGGFLRGDSRSSSREYGIFPFHFLGLGVLEYHGRFRPCGVGYRGDEYTRWPWDLDLTGEGAMSPLFKRKDHGQ